MSEAVRCNGVDCKEVRDAEDAAGWWEVIEIGTETKYHFHSATCGTSFFAALEEGEKKG